MVKARSNSKVIVYEGKLFVFGGIGYNDKLLNSVEMYFTNANKFVLIAPMKTACYDFACCRVGNHVYVIGGWTTGSIALKSVEIYNIDTDILTDGDDLPEAPYDLHACAVNNKFE